MNKQELIDKYKDKYPILSMDLQSYNIFQELWKDIKQLDEPQPIKLKDVIARIEKFDLETKAVWINEILYKLGSDYGLHKYYTGYKQGKFDGSMEREKVTVPQFVADWYEEYKDSFDYNLWEYLTDWEGQEYSDFKNWISNKNNTFQILVNMHQFGYTVEKEKQYEVILCNGQSLKTVYRQGEDRLDFEKVYGDLERFTRKQLEEAGFGWVFECEGVEIEEVKE